MRLNLDSINNWQDFVDYCEPLSSNDKGDVFEQLTELLFKTHPRYKTLYDHIYRLKDVPQSILEDIGIPRQDLGTDLIAVNGKECHPIQCKYHSDKKRAITYKEVSTFLSQFGNNKKFTNGYICSSALDTSANYKKQKPDNLTNILADTWQLLDIDFFDRARAEQKGKFKPPVVFKPREHQRKAIQDAYKHFKKEKNSRGKLIFPCGAGKSLTGFWIMEKLSANSTLIAVPSLSLVKQTLDVYLSQIVAKKKKVKWLCICSDEGIGKNDDVAILTDDVGVPCTTDQGYISKWLKANSAENIIVFTTYQSSRIISEVSKKQSFVFDLCICDEAHKTVGVSTKLFSHLLSEENISVNHRLFMTATERFYSGNKDDILSMDDDEIYGDVFSQMSFKDAIEKELLTDYNVITIEVTKNEVADFIIKNIKVELQDKWKKESESRSLASMIALRKAMKKYPIKNAVSFHSSIERARRNKEIHSHITNAYNYKPIETYTVSGKQSTSTRNDIVQQFASSDKALITNARCLTEGVDVPNIDCIVYADPKRSKIDIVQGLGRALRKKDGKEKGYVILPVVYDEKTNEIDNENFNDILAIVRGLAANDERIVEYFRERLVSKSGGGNRGDGPFSIDVEIKESDLVDNLEIRIWEKLSKFNWMPFEEARAFVRSLNLKSYEEYKKYVKKSNINLPMKPQQSYQNFGWISYGDFLGTNRIANTKRVYKSFDHAHYFIKKFNFKSGSEYCEWHTKNKPKDLPFNLTKIYSKNKKWKGVGQFIGTGFIANQLREFYNYSEASKKIKKENLKTQAEFNNWFKKNDDKRMPSNPNSTYKKTGWIGWRKFLGNTKISNYDKNKVFRDIEEVKKYTLNLNLETVEDWKAYINKNKIPDYIPRTPDTTYKKKGWKGWGDFLNSKNISNIEKSKKFVNYNRAKLIVRPHNFNSISSFRKFFKAGGFGGKIPYNPNTTYKDKGWKGWSDFLGVKIVASKNKVFFKYSEARTYMISLGIRSSTQWKVFIKNNKIHPKMPRMPDWTYKNKGWKGWAAFLGKEDK